MDLVGGFIAFFLTLSVLSYALGDNLIFRISIHIFVGSSAGFVVVAAFYSILWPQLFRPLLFGSLDERLFTLVPLGLAFLLFCKTSSRFNLLGAPVMAFLTGVGGATIVAGALLGTLLPQIKATIGLFEPKYLFHPGVSSGLASPEQHLDIFWNDRHVCIISIWNKKVKKIFRQPSLETCRLAGSCFYCHYIWRYFCWCNDCINNSSGGAV